jgi:hypothetical protein
LFVSLVANGERLDFDLFEFPVYGITAGIVLFIAVFVLVVTPGFEDYDLSARVIIGCLLLFAVLKLLF